MTGPFGEILALHPVGGAPGSEPALETRIAEAVRQGVRSEAAPVGRQLAEVRGLSNQMIGRLERIQGDLTGERASRTEDLAVLVDLISSGWKSVDERLSRIETALGARVVAPVQRLPEQNAA